MVTTRAKEICSNCGSNLIIKDDDGKPYCLMCRRPYHDFRDYGRMEKVEMIHDAADSILEREESSMNEKGICEKHGEFILTEGCPQCLAEKCDKAQEDLLDKISTLPLVTEVEAKPPVTAIVRVKPEQDIEVQSFYDQALGLKEYAEQRVITTVDDLKPATDDLSIIARVKKALEAKRKEFTQPLQDHIKEINDVFKRLMEPIEIADKTTRDKILAFQLKQKLIREEQERINALRLEAAQKEMELKGELTESVDLVEVSPEAPRRISTDMGTIGQRMIKKWEVVDFALVPDDYKMIDAGKVTRVVKAGIPSIPGIRIYEEPIIAVNAR